MKRYSLSYRKRKRKTLSKTYSKKQKIEKTQKGGGYEEEVYFVKFPQGTTFNRNDDNFLNNLNDFVKDYNETYDRFSYTRDMRLYVILCELSRYMMSIEEQDKLLFKCQYYLRSPEEWTALQETFANVVE